VAVYRVPVIEAIRVTGATCKAAGLYQRLSRHQAQEVAAEELVIAEYDRKNDPDNNNMATSLKTPLAGPPSKATMLEAAIDALSEWCDCDTTCKSMTRCVQKNPTQAHLSRLIGHVPGIRQPLWQYNLQLGLEKKSMVPDFGQWSIGLAKRC
jgi:hypothetical protein